MKNPRSTPQEERLGVLILVLLILAILITLLPGSSRADLVLLGHAAPAADELRVPAGPPAAGHVPNRAPAYLEATGRGSEGRIIRIPPRPCRDPQARVPGRFVSRPDRPRYHGRCDGLPGQPRPSRRPHRGWVWVPGHWERI